MRRLKPWDHDEIIAYNLRDGGTAVTIFADAQSDRVARARAYIDDILVRRAVFDDRPAIIVEPGCSAGDISGPYATTHFVYGCDVVPAAVDLTRQRYPAMAVERCTAEEYPVRDCDILVLCEFLEHIVDPTGFVERWLPHASTVVIGHPLVGDGYDPEPGHMWAYTEEDFDRWFEVGGHDLFDKHHFPMGYDMIMGWGVRKR